MNATLLYSIVKKNGVYDISPVDSLQNHNYEELCLAIATQDFCKFLQLFKTIEPTYKVLNQPIFLCNTECAYTNCIALNLCHFAVYNDCKEILDELLKNGGDLSQKTFEKKTSNEPSICDEMLESEDFFCSLSMLWQVKVRRDPFFMKAVKQYCKRDFTEGLSFVLPRCNCPTFTQGRGMLNAWHHKVTLCKTTRTIVEKDSLIDLIIRHFNEPVKYLQDLFDNYISSVDLGSTYEFTFDFSILCPSLKTKKPLRRSERQMCVLNEVVNSSYDVYSAECALLQHPLIETFLTCKWSHYRRFFYILIAMHVLFVVCLSSIAVLIVGNFEKFLELRSSASETEFFENADIETISCCIKVLNCLLSVLGFLLFGHALIQSFFIPLRKLFFEFEVLSNLLTSGFALVICTYGVVVPVQWQLKNHLKLIYTFNSLIILPAWINLMLIIGRIPSLGCYSLMFTTVMKNFLKVMISFVFLIIGFALSFSLVFPMSEFFNNPVGAVLRTIVMMLGEFNFAETFADSSQYLNGLAKFIFVLFVVSCSIILMNLTQGIAVNDIKLLHEISQIIRLEKETRFLYEFESIFTQEIMISNPVLKKIKRRLYDTGAIQSGLTITNKDRQGISEALFAKLVHLYKPSKTLNSDAPRLPRLNFKCFADRFNEA